MEQTQTKQNGRPKLELQLNQRVMLTLVKDKPYTGESTYGPYFLYHVKDSSGIEYSFFAPGDVHAMIAESGLRSGDTFWITKLAQQNGKKVSTKLEVEVPRKAGGHVAVALPSEGSADHFKQLMHQCVQEAVDIVKEVNTIPWQNEDVRSIALTMFIQRARV
jgi:hypothetical protein